MNGSSRGQFLREAVSRLYEERICVAFSPMAAVSSSLRDIRRRRSDFAIELKQRKASLTPETPFAEEILMSRANTVIERLASGPSSGSSSGQSTPALPIDIHPAFRNAMSSSPAPRSPTGSLYSVSRAPQSPSQAAPPAPLSYTATPRLSVAQHGLTKPLPPPPPHITVIGANGTVSSPIGLNRAISSPPDYQPVTQHPFQIAMQSADTAMHSPEKAIFRIVEMGFTADEAKSALKITDLGDGLRVDRAVEYLLRQQGLQ
jgi:hypothetical protein